MSPFPFSAGETAAGTALPAGSCDCHVHVYNAAHPTAADATLTAPDASLADYRPVKQRMGTTRAVLVTPSTYGTDNSAMLEGLAELAEDGRGVAVISGHESESELQRLHDAGVRGVRINLSLSRVNALDSVAPIARRIAS